MSYWNDRKLLANKYYVLSKGIESKEFEDFHEHRGYGKVIPVPDYLSNDRNFRNRCILVTNFSGCILAVSLRSVHLDRSFLKLFESFSGVPRSYVNSTNFLLKNGESIYFVPPPYGMDARFTLYNPSTAERFDSTRMSLKSLIACNVDFSIDVKGKIIVNKTDTSLEGRFESNLINSTSHYLKVTLCTNQKSHPSKQNKNDQDLGYTTIPPNGTKTLRIGAIDQEYNVRGKIVPNNDMANQLSNAQNILDYQNLQREELEQFVSMDASAGRTVVFFRKIINDQGISVLEEKSYHTSTVDFISNTNLVIK